MKAEKIIYRNENKVKINTPYARVYNSCIRDIKGQWSPTLNSWHLSYIKETFRISKSLFSQVVHDKTFGNRTVQAITLSQTRFNLKGIISCFTERWIILKLSEKERGIQLILSL